MEAFQDILGALKVLIAVICFVGWLRLTFSKPIRQSSYQSFRIACRVAGLAALLMSIGNILQLIWNGSDHEFMEICSLAAVAISIAQSLSFAITYILFYSDRKVRKGRICLHITPIVLFIVVYCVSTCFFEDRKVFSVPEFMSLVGVNIPLTIRFTFFCYYVFSLAMYTILFEQERHDYLNTLAKASGAEEVRTQLTFLGKAFVFTLVVGLLVVPYVFKPTFATETSFRVASILLYGVMPYIFIRYGKVYDRVRKMVEEITMVSKLTDTTEDLHGLDTMLQELTKRNEELFKRFDKYLRKKNRYLNADLKLDDEIRRFGSNRTYVANAVRQMRNQTIWEYIAYLRVSYARQLIEDDPTQKIETVAMEAGYNSLRTFNRNFKDLIGMTPAEYRSTQTGEA